MAASDTLQSQTIAFLRFPLIVGVVLLHSGFDNIELAEHPVCDNVSYLLSQVVATIAVPLFFFISGYLFFCKIDKFDGRVYVGKLKKRARTLPIPYIFWNLFTILLILPADLLFPAMMPGFHDMIAGV